MPFVVPVASKARCISLHCSLCAWVADSHRSLQAHQRTEHSNAFRCTSCSKTFSDVDAVRRHSRSTRHQINNVHANSDEVVVASSDDGEYMASGVLQSTGSRDSMASGVVLRSNPASFM